VRAHYPEIDLELLKTLPPTPSGRVDMDDHYATCRDTADCITRQIITESDRQRANRDVVAQCLATCVNIACFLCMLLESLLLHTLLRVVCSFAYLCQIARSNGGGPERGSKGEPRA
jgi:hypothetical protein